MSLEFLLTSFIVVLLPGTGVLYTMAIGLGRGFKPSIAAAVGCTFGIVPAALASIVGLAAVFHASSVAFMVVKYLGVAYLLYMAWSILKDDGILSLEENPSQQPRQQPGQKSGQQPGQKSLFRVAINGTLLNVLNPKLSLFFLAFLPQFVPPTQAGSIIYMAYLAAVFMLMTFVVFVLYGAFASTARRYVIESPTIMVWIKRAFAGTFGLLGLKLALSES